MSTVEVVAKKFEIEKKVGVGARSVILKAKCRKSAETYAVKLVTPEKSGSGRRYLRHLQNEYKVLSTLQDGKLIGSPHPNIIKPYSIHKIGGLLSTQAMYMVIEYVPGQNLLQRHDYSLSELIDIFIQVGEGLEFMHANGYVHGDMKPENVVVTPDLNATLVDFGFSCPLHTKLTGAKGTREYIAPEQVNGGLLTEMTDIYNFGASIYRMVTGKALPARMPSHRSKESAVFIAAGKDMKATPMYEARPGVPHTLSDVVMQCCEHKQSNRPKSMREVVARLRHELPLLANSKVRISNVSDDSAVSRPNDARA